MTSRVVCDLRPSQSATAPPSPTVFWGAQGRVGAGLCSRGRRVGAGLGFGWGLQSGLGLGRVSFITPPLSTLK